MNFCPKCGTQNNEGVKFCTNCGTAIAKEEKKTETPKKEGMATASLILGIISLILAFACIIFIPVVLSIPLAIIGIVLGIVNLCKKGKRFGGLILNIASLIISVIMAFVIAPIVFAGIFINEAATDGTDLNKFFNQLYNELDRQSSDNYVAGKYNCKSYSGSGESSEYIVRLELNKDNTFLWGKYGDTKDNYVIGTYTFSDLDKKNASGEYSYYNIKLDGDEYYREGIKQTEPYASEYEFGITGVKTKKQGIIMNTRTYNMYYCYEE